MFLVNCHAPAYGRRVYDCDYKRSGCPLGDTLCFIGPYTLFAENKKTASLVNTYKTLTSLRKAHMCGDRNQIV